MEDFKRLAAHMASRPEHTGMSLREHLLELQLCTWLFGLKNALLAGLMNLRERNRKARRQVLFESCQSAQAQHCPLKGRGYN